MDAVPTIKYQGGLVLMTKPGLHDVVGVLDFNSLYPSAIQDANLCPSTFVNKPTNHKTLTLKWKEKNAHAIEHVATFVQDVSGILPSICRDLVATRKEYKTRMETTTDSFEKIMYNVMQLAVKRLTNAIYGQCANTRCAFYNINVAASITARGRWCTETAMAIAYEKFPDVQIVAGDTDSLMMTFPTTLTGEEARAYVWNCCTEIFHAVSAVIPPPHKFEPEKVYAPMLVTNKKKHYLGEMFEPDKNGTLVFKKRDIKGLTIKRGDSVPVMKTFYDQILQMLFYDKKTIDEIVAYIAQKCDDLLSNPNVDDWIVSKSIKSNIDDYKNDPPTVVVWNKMQERNPGMERPGMISFVYVKNDAIKNRNEKAEDPQYVREHALPLDMEYYIQTTVLQPLCLEFFSAFYPSEQTNELMARLFPAIVSRVTLSDSSRATHPGLLAFFSTARARPTKKAKTVA